MRRLFFALLIPAAACGEMSPEAKERFKEMQVARSEARAAHTYGQPDALAAACARYIRAGGDPFTAGHRGRYALPECGFLVTSTK